MTPNTASVVARSVAKPAVRVVSSTIVRAMGTKAPDDFLQRRTLVVAPHPDDETLGCGATIARMRAMGTDVHVVFVSGGGGSPKPRPMSDAELIELRRGEAQRALALLDVDEGHLVHWDLDDGQLVGEQGDITAALSELVRSTRAEQVLVTSVADRHPDHAATARAARDLLGPATSTRLYEYPIWQRVPALVACRNFVSRPPRAAVGVHPVTRPTLVPTGGFRAAKARAIAAYESQLPHFPTGFVDDFLLPFESFTEVVSGRQ